MRILVLWADRESPNLGVRVLAEGARALAMETWPNATVEFQDFWANESDLSIGGRAVLSDFGRAQGPIKKKLDRYDLILDTGAGDGFTDIYSFRKLASIHYTQSVAHSMGIPVVMLPQTIGPFNSSLSTMLARRSLRLMSSVSVRDSVSLAAARELGRADVVRGTDLVFALPSPTGAVSGRSDVLLNVSGLLWRENAHVDHRAYRTQLVRLYDALLASGRKVSLLAHVLDSPSPSNDLPALEEMASLVSHDAEVIVPDSLEAARSRIGSADLVVGSRMHACLNALSCGTPAIALAYSRKFAPLMDDLGWGHVVELSDTMDIAQSVMGILDRSTDSMLLEVESARKHAQDLLKAVRAQLREVATVGAQRNNVR